MVADRAKLVAAQRKDDDLDDFLKDYADDGLVGLDREEQHRDPDTRMADVEQDHFVPCQKSLLFSSQETPPATFTEPAKLDILSLNTA
jgi:hypothetical protein